jgi:acetyltransferase-like isoleucine patch superfamily enzyme
VSVDIRDITGAWDYGTLPPNVSVGPDCFIERRESFRRYRSTRPLGLSLGARVQVYTWTEFSVEPDGVIEVGDDCVLAGAVFMCAERITLGRGVVVPYHVTIADSDFHPRGREARRRDAIANAPGGDLRARPRYESRPVVIEDDVWIGIGAIVLKGTRLGAGARIGAGSVVTHDVPRGACVAGNPARIVSGAPV